MYMHNYRKLLSRCEYSIHCAGLCLLVSLTVGWAFMCNTPSVIHNYFTRGVVKYEKVIEHEVSCLMLYSCLHD